MPKETFWDSSRAVENDGVSEPVLTVTWGEQTPGIYLNGIAFDDSGLARLESTIRRARGKERTVSVNLVANTADYISAMDAAAAATRAVADELRAAGISAADMGEATLAALKLSTDSGSAETT